MSSSLARPGNEHAFALAFAGALVPGCLHWVLLGPTLVGAETDLGLRNRATLLDAGMWPWLP